jgi:hypothetical protein
MTLRFLKNKRMIARTLPFFNWQPSTYVVTPAAILSGQAGGASTGKEDNFFVKSMVTNHEINHCRMANKYHQIYITY